MIYEYVLSFDTPLKHVTHMQPFVKKLTGVEPKSGSGSTETETETATDSQRVNTSILATSKLIYVEAVAVFYKHNTIHFDAQMCTFESLVSPRATDLSLAKQIVIKMDDVLEVEGRLARPWICLLPPFQPSFPSCAPAVYTSSRVREPIP
jgi:hypothetical protein